MNIHLTFIQKRFIRLYNNLINDFLQLKFEKLLCCEEYIDYDMFNKILIADIMH